MKKIVVLLLTFVIVLFSQCFAKTLDIQVDDSRTYTPTYMLKKFDAFADVEYNPSVKSKYIPQENAFIPKGVKFKIKLLEGINSKKWRKGQLVRIAAAEPVLLDGKEIIAKDTEGTAFLVKSRKAAGLGRKGKLEIAGNEIMTVNGVKVPLTNGICQKGKTDQGAGTVAALTFVGGMFIKGSNVELPEGYEFEVAVRDDVDLGFTIEDLKAGNLTVKKEKVVNVILP